MFLSAQVFTWQFASLVQEHHIFNTNISQGSVAIFARCGGVFSVDFIANLLANLPVKEL